MDTQLSLDFDVAGEQPEYIYPANWCSDETKAMLNIQDALRSMAVTYEEEERQKRKRLLNADSKTRKGYPLATGLLDYFPDALAEVAKLSYQGNQKHNPGEPLHHARGKSTDHADCIMRHLVGRGGFDGDTRESAAVAWRALAMLQEELEKEFNLPLPRGAKD